MIRTKTNAFKVDLKDISVMKERKSGFWIKIVCFVIAALVTSPAFAQILIEGTIKDKDTKEGLPFSHVYVCGGDFYRSCF